MTSHRSGLRKLVKLAIVITFVALPVIWTTVNGAVAPDFQYNLISVTNTAPGQMPVIRFSVTDPTNGDAAYNIKTHPAFTQTANGTSRVFLQIGWDTRDYNNFGSGGHLLPVGPGAALPIGINVLTPAVVNNGDGTFTATSTKPIPLFVTGSGVVAMEGHPAGPDANGNYTVRLQVPSVFKPFAITDATPVPRRAVVDKNKCLSCHGTLSLHGNNRTNEVQVCVVCHNPNQTDISWRQYGDGPEVSVDFKSMIHSIHAGDFRENPFIVIGFQRSIHNFSDVRFPRELRNCLNCHNDRTFELPLGSNVLGSTIDTRSLLTTTGKMVDGDPTNDLNITPIASVCSSCHDKREVRRHMREKGASFAVLQSDIDSGRVREQCARCHGPGRDKDVRKVHEIDHDDD